MINKERLLKHLNAMQTISTIDDVPGINRIAFTDQDWAGRDYLIKQLKELNLTLRYDEFGNVIGRYEGKNPDAPAIMTGSHTDSVPQGGNYDGLAGIAAALEVITDLKETNTHLNHPLDIVLFMCEESSRFGSATLGSQAMRGQLSRERLQTLCDKKGLSLYDVLKERGFNPDIIP